MEIKSGTIVKSVSGRDSGSFYAVIKFEDGFAYIADGRRRKAENPKKKNVRHLQKTERFIEVENITDKKLRVKLHSLNFGVGAAHPKGE
ncbi:MAG: KOW domain-containing RNA-binding protein [Eubacterium sp.]|jgi:ribosomal protein L14E/L6E/L27E|nr:KOW domain-containing RNA-binding protein [Eubacterium sp.]